MTKPKLYEKTVSILVDAYFNDTLSHMLCQACAVGNLVAYYTNQKDEDGKLYCQDWSWSGIVRGCYPGDKNENSKSIAISQIEATGYTANQLLQIERAFENCKSQGDKMFNGLMAVIDVLDKIHQNTDNLTTQSTKKRFNKNQSCVI